MTSSVYGWNYNDEQYIAENWNNNDNDMPWLLTGNDHNLVNFITSKAKALWLGPRRHRQDKPFGFRWPEKPIRVLGTFISYNEK